MATDNNRIELTEEQLQDSILPLNHVMVEMVYNNDYKTTKSGIVVGLPDRKTYNENATCADMQENWGIVYKLPDKLYYDEKSHDSMDWEVEDMVIQIGDKVWFSIVESANAQEVTCDGRLFKILSYQSLYVVKRELTKTTYIINGPLDLNSNCLVRSDIETKVEIIPLNGYILCQTLNCKKISDLDVISEDKIDKTRVVVRYVGKPNLRYKTKSYIDHTDLQPGDEIVLSPRLPFVYLERKKFFAQFDGDNLYLVVPRRKVFLVMNREEKIS